MRARPSAALEQWRAVPLVLPEEEHFFREVLLTGSSRRLRLGSSSLSPQSGSLTLERSPTLSAEASFLRPGSGREQPGRRYRRVSRALRAGAGLSSALLIREAARFAASHARHEACRQAPEVTLRHPKHLLQCGRSLNPNPRVKADSCTSSCALEQSLGNSSDRERAESF